MGCGAINTPGMASQIAGNNQSAVQCLKRHCSPLAVQQVKKQRKGGYQLSVFRQVRLKGFMLCHSDDMVFHVFPPLNEPHPRFRCEAKERDTSMGVGFSANCLSRECIQMAKRIESPPRRRPPLRPC